MAKRLPPKDAEREKRKDAYIEALKAGKNLPDAIEASRLRYNVICRERRQDQSFAGRERAIVGHHKAFHQRSYLEALKANFGNKTRARRETEVTRSIYEQWTTDKEFLDSEAEVFEFFVDTMNEQNIRLAVGAESTVRDTKHLQWVLSKVDKRWEDKPKVIDHRYGGEITVKSTTDEILSIMGEDVELGELVQA